MDIEHFRNYCLSKNDTTEELPFGPDTLVFKVRNKIFALCDINSFDSINLKCDPALAIELREQHPDGIMPGYHMNKKHWNTVMTFMPDKLILELTDHSYALVTKQIKK
ncbi:MAG: MmcQ/YjbR family DNA-binding protein [Bacteroidia bacterium]|nr:MmcQ/YjbR family DNA-binding protein [Bacteroidia bacterium]MCO5253237.1 MmcQ/YjbR family DNA-binding protein [Bacteroidota bacterium]MCZ2130543.1 MmcQ/YjbR family DNA-binding protein [Bacteroidia bacterium]